ncbi:MAG: hypothetical protein QM644_17380 [Mobilitalea sp.]
MNIIEPSPKERDKTIEDILLKGLTKPNTLWEYLYDIYRALGLRYIFCDTIYAIILTVISTIGFVLVYPVTQEQYIYAAVFTVTQVLFMFLVLFTEAIEKVSGLYELKMTCKYTVQQITAFRILVFSLIGTVFTAFISLYFSWMLSVYDLLRIFSLSLSALFLCAFLTMFILRHFSWKWNHYFFMPGWIICGILPAKILGEQWEMFLAKLPIAITLFAAAIACILFLMETKKLMDIRTREVIYYVGC